MFTAMNGMICIYRIPIAFDVGSFSPLIASLIFLKYVCTQREDKTPVESHLIIHTDLTSTQPIMYDKSYNSKVDRR